MAPSPWSPWAIVPTSKPQVKHEIAVRYSFVLTSAQWLRQKQGPKARIGPASGWPNSTSGATRTDFGPLCVILNATRPAEAGLNWEKVLWLALKACSYALQR